MKLGLIGQWAIHQAFGAKKGDKIIALLQGPLGVLLNKATDDKAQHIVDEINGIATAGLAQIGAATT